MHTNSYDEARALPREEPATIALRTQQVIAHESGVTNTIDPLGGAYFRGGADRPHGAGRVRLLPRIDALGGMVEAVKRGFPQREIADAAYEHRSDIDRGDRAVVGVNDYGEGDAAQLAILRIGPALERKRIARLRAVRARRNTAAVGHVLWALRFVWG